VSSRRVEETQRPRVFVWLGDKLGFVPDERNNRWCCWGGRRGDRQLALGQWGKVRPWTAGAEGCAIGLIAVPGSLNAGRSLRAGPARSGGGFCARAEEFGPPARHCGDAGTAHHHKRSLDRVSEWLADCRGCRENENDGCADSPCVVDADRRGVARGG